MGRDSSGQLQNDTFQDEGSVAEDIHPPSSHELQEEIQDDRNTELTTAISEQAQIRQAGTAAAKDAKVDTTKSDFLEEENHYADAWNLSLEHANATYQSSTSFTSSVMDSERSDHNRQTNASERLHQQLQRQSLLDDTKKNQILQSDGERIANSIIAEKEAMAGLHPSPSQKLPPANVEEGSLDLEQPSALPLGGPTVSSSASTKAPAPPDLNRRSNYRLSQPGAVAMVGMQTQANVPEDDRTVQVGTEEPHQKEPSSPLVDAILVSDEVEAPTSPQSVEASAAVPIDERDSRRWGLRDRRVKCIICVLVAIIAALATGLSFLFVQNKDDLPIANSSPTTSPTMAPVPTASPTSRMASLQALLSKYVSDVTPWEDIESTQYQALDWLANEDTWRDTKSNSSDAEQVIVERYAMSVLYFSLDGPNWSLFVDLNSHVCGWQVESTIFGTLPGELFLLPELESVSIVDCSLVGTLPSEILQAPSLSWLTLLGNSLDGTIDNAANPGIEELDLGGNDFTGVIPASFADLTSAVYLELEDNNLSGPLPDELSNMEDLYHLSVHNN
ncbi:MAG: hypothetical protein SGBAC_011060, partial [Bacillariaceae sp.]